MKFLIISYNLFGLQVPDNLRKVTCLEGKGAQTPSAGMEVAHLEFDIAYFFGLAEVEGDEGIIFIQISFC